MSGLWNCFETHSGAGAQHSVSLSKEHNPWAPCETSVQMPDITTPGLCRWRSPNKKKRDQTSWNQAKVWHLNIEYLETSKNSQNVIWNIQTVAKETIMTWTLDTRCSPNHPDDHFIQTFISNGIKRPKSPPPHGLCRFWKKIDGSVSWIKLLKFMPKWNLVLEHEISPWTHPCLGGSTLFTASVSNMRGITGIRYPPVRRGLNCVSVNIVTSSYPGWIKSPHVATCHT